MTVLAAQSFIPTPHEIAGGERAVEPTGVVSHHHKTLLLIRDGRANIGVPASLLGMPYGAGVGALVEPPMLSVGVEARCAGFAGGRFSSVTVHPGTLEIVRYPAPFEGLGTN